MGLVLALLHGLLYRVRGGWFKLPSTQLARLCWVIPVGLTVLLGFPWWIALGSAVGAFLGLMIPHGKWFAMRQTLRDTIWMTVIGIIRWSLIHIPIVCVASGTAWIALGSLLSGLVYLLGTYVPEIKGPFLGHSDGVQTIEYSEVFYGMLFGYMLWLTLGL